MADISPGVVTDWGSIINSFGQGQTAQAQTRVNTGLAQQQQQQAAMQNQIMQARMPMIMKIIHDFTNQSDQSAEQSPQYNATLTEDNAGNQQSPGVPAQPDTGPPEETGAPTPPDNGPLSAAALAKTDAAIIGKYFVDPKGTQQEQQNIYKGTMLDPQYGQMYGQQRDNAVGSRVAQSQKAASQMYVALDAAADAAPGGAIFALQAIAPNVSAQIKKQYTDPMQQDAAARAWAAHTAASMHMYTGRDVIPRADGVYLDKLTGKPVPGIERSGLSAEQWSALAEKGASPTTVKNSDGSESQLPLWQHPSQSGIGATSLPDWVNKVAQRGGIIGSMPTVGGGVGAATKATIAKTSAQAQAKAPVAPNAAAVGTSPQVPASPNASGARPADPILQSALADKSYRDPALAPGVPNRTPTTIQAAEQSTYGAKRKELQEDGAELANNAGTALMNFQAAQRILGAPDGSHWHGLQGVPGTVMQHLASLGYDTDTADHRAEAAKYLTNAAVSNLKTTYGGRPGVFDVKVNLEKAFPNITDGMPYGAVQDLIKSQIAQASYLKSYASRVPSYLNAGNTPTSFPDWNNKYFPRSQALESAMTGSAGGASKWSPAKIQAYADAHFGGDKQKATAWLNK